MKKKDQSIKSIFNEIKDAADAKKWLTVGILLSKLKKKKPSKKRVDNFISEQIKGMVNKGFFISDMDIFINKLKKRNFIDEKAFKTVFGHVFQPTCKSSRLIN